MADRENQQGNVLVQVRDITKRFGELLVLDRISFDVYRHEFLCIVGPTGCGKTTFLNSLTRLYDITSGEILLEGEPVNLKKHNISYVFQDASTMPWLTVEDNIRFGLTIRKVPKEAANQRVEDVIKLVNLQKFRYYYPRQLSISMLQRVVIARAFATNPTLLLMDEPYGQLDIEMRYMLEDELVALWEKTSSTVVFITHNIEEAVYLGQRILVLTNKPATIKQEIHNRLPRPRNIVDSRFVELREKVTDLIKWW
jgi:sulfonate transport system ATP-binding protein